MNLSSVGEKNCVVCSFFCIFITITIIISSISSSSKYFVVLLDFSLNP